MQAESDTLFPRLEQDSLQMVVKPAVEPPVVSLFEEHSLSDTHDFTLVERLETGNNFGFVILFFFLIML